MIHSHNFTPFFGIVENMGDGDKSGAAQVRVLGYNSANQGVLPTENLRWFRIGVNNSAAMSGIGVSPTGYMVGSYVFGFYIDQDLQDGIIICAFNGTPGGKTDVSPVATGEGGEYIESLKKNVASGVIDARGETWDEPSTQYASEYPLNQVFQSRSGHVVEFDDTPGAERIVVHHKSGTFEEIHPDGKKVNKTIKDSFEINLSNEYVYIGGNLNAVVAGDYRLSVGGEYFVKASNVVFDTKTVDIYGISNANDHVSSNVSGMSHVHDGVMPGPYLSGMPVGASTMFTPSPANSYYLETEDSGFTPDVIQQGLNQGFLTADDVISIETEQAEIVEEDDTPEVQTKADPVECAAAIVNGVVDYNAYLSETVKLRDLSIGAVVSQYTIRDQVGLTRDQIICNLQNIAENVIEPLKRQYPNVMVTSAFRQGTGTSQHLKGEAIDIQFSGISNSQYFEIAQWIKSNLPHDQLLLEYKSIGTKLPWIHISLVRGRKQRYQVMTFFNHKKYADGLVKLA